MKEIVRYINPYIYLFIEIEICSCLTTTVRVYVTIVPVQTKSRVSGNEIVHSLMILIQHCMIPKRLIPTIQSCFSFLHDFKNSMKVHHTSRLKILKDSTPSQIEISHSQCTSTYHVLPIKKMCKRARTSTILKLLIGDSSTIDNFSYNFNYKRYEATTMQWVDTPHKDAIV